MNTPTDRALAVVRRMSSQEREQVAVIFDEYIPSSDPHWLQYPHEFGPA